MPKVMIRNLSLVDSYLLDKQYGISDYLNENYSKEYIYKRSIKFYPCCMIINQALYFNMLERLLHIQVAFFYIEHIVPIWLLCSNCQSWLIAIYCFFFFPLFFPLFFFLCRFLVLRHPHIWIDKMLKMKLLTCAIDSLDQVLTSHSALVRCRGG